MRIAAITNPLHVVKTPSKPTQNDGLHHYLDLEKCTMRSLIKNHVCPAVPNDPRTPVLCSRECIHYRYCEIGKEYIRRLER